MKNNSPETSDLDRIDGDTPLTPQEEARLAELVSVSYPQPDRSIKNQVMKQIQAEQAAKRMNRIVRYGSIAACFVLIMGVVIGLVPFLNRVSKDAKNEADDVIALTADEADMAMYGHRSDDAAYDVVPTHLADEEKPTENAAAEVPELNMSECEPSFAPETIQSEITCTVHGTEYHVFSAELVNFIGAEDFRHWHNSEGAKDTCGTPSVFTLIRDFRISRDTFEMLTQSGDIPYNADDLYSSES